MKITLFILLILVLQLLHISAQKTSKNQTISDEKIKQLQELQRKSLDGVIEFLTPEQFNKFVYEPHRQYDLIIFFTAKNCHFCSQVYQEYYKVSSFYESEGHLYKIQNQDGSAQIPVFFAQVNYQKDFQKIFQDLQYTSIPDLLVTNAKIGEIKSNSEQILQLKNNQWNFSPTDGTITAQKILDYVNQRTGLSVQLIVPLSEKLQTIFIFASVVGIALLFLKYCTQIISNTKVWFFGSLIIYVVCSSGIIYNILHQVPMTQNGEWYLNQQRQQLALEGYVMAASIGFTGLLFISLTKAHLYCQNKLINYMVYTCLFLGITLVIFFIEDIYAKKGFYSPKFHPPAHYVHGSYLNDQGNSI